MGMGQLSTCFPVLFILFISLFVFYLLFLSLSLSLSLFLSYSSSFGDTGATVLYPMNIFLFKYCVCVLQYRT